MKQCMLTTIDNPFNPFTQFEQWFTFDMEKGYDCCGRVARLLVDLSFDVSTEEELNANEKAIDTIIRNDFLNIFKKVEWKPNDAKNLDIQT